MKQHSKAKKITLIILTAIISLALLYTAAWFAITNIIHNKIQQSIASTSTNVANIDKVSLQTSLECFPLICINLKDFNLKTTAIKTPQAKEPRVLEISAITLEPIMLQINNIFKPTHLVYNKKNAEINLKINDITNNIALRTNLSAQNLKIKISNNGFNLSINKSILEKALSGNAFEAIAELDAFNLNIKPTKEYTNIKYSLSDLNILAINKLLKEENKYKITHSTANIDVVAKEKKLIIKDLKLTDSLNQVLLKGWVQLDDDNKLSRAFNYTLKAKENNFLISLIAKFVITDKEKYNNFINMGK